MFRARPTASIALSSSDGTDTAYTATNEWPTQQDWNSCGIVMHQTEDSRVLALNGSYGAETNHDGSLIGTAGNIHVGVSAGTMDHAFGIRNIRRYAINSIDQGKATIDELS